PWFPPWVLFAWHPSSRVSQNAGDPPMTHREDSKLAAIMVTIRKFRKVSLDTVQRAWFFGILRAEEGRTKRLFGSE
ncbi:hypothetical protein, partial [Escherichia coli]|uniref:hypothetical protein n=1 Tax=Escherichia coli TaxID=562 RepID=UPI001954F0E5